MEKEFPYESYEKSLVRILEQASKDYWVQYVDINRHQVGVAKTYLWVSAAMLGSYTSLFVFAKSNQLTINPAVLMLALCAFILCILAFGLCLYGLPARNMYKRVGQSWGTFSKMAYEHLAAKNDATYRNVLTSLLDEFDIAAVHNLQTNSKRAKFLRATSWLLVVSFLFSILTIIGFSLDHFIK